MPYPDPNPKANLNPNPDPKPSIVAVLHFRSGLSWLNVLSCVDRCFCISADLSINQTVQCNGHFAVMNTCSHPRATPIILNTNIHRCKSRWHHWHGLWKGMYCVLCTVYMPCHAMLVWCHVALPCVSNAFATRADILTPVLDPYMGCLYNIGGEVSVTWA